jgi:hypothetical protein
MANKFGEAALIAARLDVPAGVSAAERWDVAVRRVYPDKPYLRKKGAPKSAFLGLCAAGLVRGIAVGEPVAAGKNGEYAVKAAQLLKAGTHRTAQALWEAVATGEDTPQGAQMDVVLALWKNGLVI